jgi:DNA-binding NarL/FixJ family response regulator
MTPVRLLIADDAATRLGIRMALGDEVAVCAEAQTAGEAIRAAMREQPEICLVGRGIPGDWLVAVRGICRAAPRAAVAVLAHAPDVDDLLDAIRSGAIGYVPGATNEARLRKVVAAVLAGEAVVPRSMMLELLLELRAGGSLMTPREAQVLGLVRRGHNTADIASRLGIRPVTVRRHVSDLVRKLGVENRRALVDVAERGERFAPAGERA